MLKNHGQLKESYQALINMLEKAQKEIIFKSIKNRFKSEIIKNVNFMKTIIEKQR